MIIDQALCVASLMVVILMLGGIQLASQGIIGDYLGRMFNETKARPLHMLQGLELSEPADCGPSAPPAASEN